MGVADFVAVGNGSGLRVWLKNARQHPPKPVRNIPNALPPLPIPKSSRSQDQRGSTSPRKRPKG